MPEAGCGRIARSATASVTGRSSPLRTPSNHRPPSQRSAAHPVDPAVRRKDGRRLNDPLLGRRLDVSRDEEPATGPSPFLAAGLTLRRAGPTPWNPWAPATPRTRGARAVVVGVLPSAHGDRRSRSLPISSTGPPRAARVVPDGRHPDTPVGRADRQGLPIHGSSTSLPVVWPVAIWRWASAASSRGYVDATNTRSSPLPARRASSAGRRARMSSPGSAPGPPPSSLTPSRGAAREVRDRRDPRPVRRPAPATRPSPRRCRPGRGRRRPRRVRAPGRGRAGRRRTPPARRRARAAGRGCARWPSPITRAPRSRASCTADRPTPPDAPWTSTVSPSVTPVASRVCHAVAPVSSRPGRLGPAERRPAWRSAPVVDHQVGGVGAAWPGRRSPRRRPITPGHVCVTDGGHHARRPRSPAAAAASAGSPGPR